MRYDLIHRNTGQKRIPEGKQGALEISTLLGLSLGLFAILGGALLEGLHLGAIVQPTAAVIVLGGTLGATLLSFPMQDIKSAWKALFIILKPSSENLQNTVEEIIQVAQIARREGVLAIEAYRKELKDQFFSKSIKYVIDGFEPATIKEIMKADIEQSYDEEDSLGKVWETAGGFAPTIGIIGAVLGLIHVMGSLKDPGKDLGEGISVAFVATVYGVAMANLFLIPIGNKMKRVAERNLVSKEIVRVGVTGILDGLNPMFLRERLEVYLPASKRTDKKS